MDLSQLSDDDLLAEMQSAMGGAAPQPAAPANNMVLSGINAGGQSYENLEADRLKSQQSNAAAIDLEKQKKGIEGVGSEAGRVTLAREALKSVRSARKALFP